MFDGESVWETNPVFWSLSKADLTASAISGRRGKIMGVDSDGHFQKVKAKLPQAELHNYATKIRSLTGGRGFHTETHSHYENLPREFEQKVIAAYKRQREE